MRKFLWSLQNFLLLFICFPWIALGQQYWTPWSEYPTNPVYSPLPNRAYYPTVQYNKNQFDGHGNAAYYKMWSDTPSPISLAISNDGVFWQMIGNVVGLTNARHSVVLYDPDCFGEGNGYYYKIWYWNSAFSTSIAGFRTAKSADGINWVQDSPCTQNPLFPLVFGPYGSSYFYNFFGPSTVFYNANATNNPSDPMSFRYVLYYIGSAAGNPPGQWDNTCLAYSIDGVDWSRYGSLPVLIPSGNSADWDGFFSTSASVIKTENKYHMWYSGSPDGGGNIKGIGYASSNDGINWTRASSNPIFYITDGKAWRNVRTYACSVLFDPDYFGSPSDNKALKMWFSGLSSTGIYSVGLATSNFMTDANVSTVNANPPIVIANGTSASVITVSLKAIEGEPIVGSTVVLSANQGSSQISPLSAITDSNGQAVFTVTDTIIEMVSYIATDITNNVEIAQQAVVSFESPPLPPIKLSGKQHKNDFGVVREYFNLLSWQPNPADKIEGYNIYRNGTKIATVSASVFSYEDHNRKKGKRTLYSVTSFIGDNESKPINVIVK